MGKKDLSAVVCFALVLSFVLAVSVVGVSRSENTLNVANIGAVRTLDPAVAYDTKTYVPIQNIYEPLVTFKTERKDGKLVRTSKELAPSLAVDWAISEDRREYTFQIRKDVKFHSGDTLDAEDVKYSLNRTITMGQGPAWYLDQIKTIEVTGEYEVKVTLKSPYSPFLRILASEPCAYIVNKETVEQHGGVAEGETNEWMTSHEDGTGPFQLEKWDPGEELTLTSFENYWRSPPKLEKIRLKVIEEPSTQMMLLQSGDIDLIALGLTWKQIASLEGATGIKLYQKEGWKEVRFFFLNTKREPFDEVAVRRAISYAIDYEGIIDNVLQGYGTRLKSPLPEGYLCHDPSIQMPYHYNPELAKDLLAEAGYPEGFKVEVSYPTADVERKQVSEIIRANLAEIGIESTMKGYSWPVMLDKWDKGEMQMAATKWAPTSDPDTLLTSMFHTDSHGAGGNYSFYSDKTVDGLLDKAGVVQDPKERCELYSVAQQIIVSDAPWLFLYHPTRVFPVRDVVKDFAMPDIEHYNFYATHKTAP